MDIVISDRPLAKTQVLWFQYDGYFNGWFRCTGAMARYPAIQAGVTYMVSGYFTDATDELHPPPTR